MPSIPTNLFSQEEPLSSCYGQSHRAAQIHPRKLLSRMTRIRNWCNDVYGCVLSSEQCKTTVNSSSTKATIRPQNRQRQYRFPQLSETTEQCAERAFHYVNIGNSRCTDQPLRWLAMSAAQANGGGSTWFVQPEHISLRAAGRKRERCSRQKILGMPTSIQVFRIALSNRPRAGTKSLF